MDRKMVGARLDSETQANLQKLIDRYGESQAEVIARLINDKVRQLDRVDELKESKQSE